MNQQENYEKAKQRWSHLRVHTDYAVCGCNNPDVIIINYFKVPAEWKCRNCKKVFEFEPDKA